RLLQAVGADGLRYERLGGRVEETGARSGDSLQHRQLPDVCGSGEEQDRGRALRADADDVRTDHHGPSRQPVRPDTAGERDGGAADRVAGEDEPDARGPGAEVVTDRPDETDGDEGVADRRAG